jgi:hypothetical protein
MAAQEHQRQLVVPTRDVEDALLGGNQGQSGPNDTLVPHIGKDVVPGHCVQPTGGVLRHTNERPPLQRPEKRLLNGLLSKLDASGAHHPNQGSGDPAGTTPEKPLDHDPGVIHKAPRYPQEPPQERKPSPQSSTMDPGEGPRPGQRRTALENRLDEPVSRSSVWQPAPPSDGSPGRLGDRPLSQPSANRSTKVLPDEPAQQPRSLSPRSPVRRSSAPRAANHLRALGIRTVRRGEAEDPALPGQPATTWRGSQRRVPGQVPLQRVLRLGGAELPRRGAPEKSDVLRHFDLLSSSQHPLDARANPEST